MRNNAATSGPSWKKRFTASAVIRGRAAAQPARSSVGWMSVRAAVSGDGDDAVLAEAERGEDSATYEEALRRELLERLRAVLERHAARMKPAHDRVRSLRDRAA